jgi:hypothetical protein
LNNPTLTENAGDHPVSYTTQWDTIYTDPPESWTLTSIGCAEVIMGSNLFDTVYWLSA